MGCNKVEKKIQNTTEYEKTIKKDSGFVKSITKSIETIINICFEGFSRVFGITASSTIEFVENITLKMAKKFNISSNQKFITTMELLAKKKFYIDSTIDFTTTINMVKKAVIYISGDASFIFGSNRILGNLDSLTLDEMDIQTLGELDFGKGINFILAKKILINSGVSFNTTIDLVSYKYNKLLDFDPDTLGVLDVLTLEQMDRSIV